MESKKIVREVSTTWFEKNSFTKEECPECKHPLQVIVSVGTLMTCPACGQRLEFVYQERD